jgi:DNA excision repair protein ERCC-8
LIAVGTDDRRVRLCDLKSGGSSHLLAGHAQTITTVAWSPTEEYLLATVGLKRRRFYRAPGPILPTLT